MADKETVTKCIYYYCIGIVDILETNKARDLIFGIGTHWDLGKKCTVWTPGGTTYMSKSYLDHMLDTYKARDLIFCIDAP